MTSGSRRPASWPTSWSTTRNATVPRTARLLVIAHSDDEEAAIGRALAAAPDGVTAVRVVRLGDRVLRRHHVRRKITVTPDLIALMRVFRPSCCDYSLINPWRLVVVGRPPLAERIVWERAEPDSVDLLLVVPCAACGECTFFDNVPSPFGWCRSCGAAGEDVWKGPGAYGPGELPFARAPGVPHDHG